jgi:hypothetical protein
MGQVAQALVVQANAAIDHGDAPHARELIEQAAALAPHSADLAAARARLGEGHKSNASQVANDIANDAASDNGDSDNLQHPPLTPQQSAELGRLVQRADTAARQGNLMLPPGDSAYDLYRQALAMDGNNPVARQGLESLPGLAIGQFNQALASGNLSAAGNRLADLSDLAPGDSNQSVLRMRLAGAWMDQAEQQLQNGDRAGATQSLDSARKLAPGNPRLATLMQRLQSGG